VAVVVLFGAGAASFSLLTQPVLSTGVQVTVVDPRKSTTAGPQPRITEEVVEERTTTSRTWATDDGGRTVRIFPAPIHFRNANGNLQRIDNDLVASPLAGYAVRNAANRYRADLPRDARQDVRFAIGDDVVRFALRGAAGAGREVSGEARYYGEQQIERCNTMVTVRACVSVTLVV